MSKRISRSFFLVPEALFIGYSRKHAVFCSMVYDAFAKAGTRIYPVNPNYGKDGAVEVFPRLEDVPAKPEFAYVVTPSAVSATLVEGLAAF